MRRIKWLAAASLAALALIVGGTWTYIHVFQDDAPAPLALDATPAAPPSAGDSGSTSTSSGPSAADPATLDGTWKRPAEARPATGSRRSSSARTPWRWAAPPTSTAS